MTVFSSPSRKWIGRFCLLLVAYFVAGIIGLSVPYMDSHISLIWAPTGIAVACLLRWGLSYWPAVWLGALLVNLTVGGPGWLALGISIGNLLGPLIAAVLLSVCGFDRHLKRRRDLLLYLFVAVLGGMLITSSNGVFQLWLAGIVPSEQVFSAGLIWWLGDAMGVLVCGIPLLTFHWQALKQAVQVRRVIELSVALGLVVLMGVLIFNGPVNNAALYHPVLYIPFLLLAWLAIRGGIAVASSAALILSAQAVWATSQGIGPFHSDDVHFNLAMLWGYMVTATIIPVLITILVGQLLESKYALQQSEERYRQLLSNSPVGIMHYGPDLVATYINARFAEIMRAPEAYFEGLDCKKLKDSSVIPALQKALTGERALYEGQYTTSYGQTTLWISMRCAPVVDALGNIVGGIVLVEDITDRKQAEQELHKFKFFSDNASDMHMLLDDQTRIRYANRQACEFLGYSQEELLKMSVPDIDPNFSRVQMQAVIESCKLDWIPPFETEHKHKNGALLPVEISARAHEFNGEWLCFSSARDISDRKALEARAKRQRDGLAALNEVAALTHLGLEEQLREALGIGRRYYGLEYAIVSRVEEDNYTVLAQVTPPGSLVEGNQFFLGHTYCDITLSLGDVFATREMGHSTHRGHPCYENFGLETYIGAPVHVEKELYGTVSFSSAGRYEREFDDGDREFMLLLARWIGSVITLNQNREALGAREAWLQTIIETEPECVKVVAPDGKLVQMNKAGLSILEAESVEQINRIGLLQFVDEPYREAFAQLNGLALEKGESGSLEFTITGQHGRVRWLETHVAPLRDSAGQITSVLSVTRDITLLKEQQQKLELLAHYDSLTGLPNRTLLAERMQREQAQAQRYKSGFVICYMDLDGFKPINDALGHDAGDVILKVIAQRLKQIVRDVDTVARMGGDEFVLILSNVDSVTACLPVVERVLEAVSEPILVGNDNCQVSASLGLALYPDAGNDPETLLRHADQAMYVAKEQGKNGYSIHAVTSKSSSPDKSERVH